MCGGARARVCECAERPEMDFLGEGRPSSPRCRARVWSGSSSASRGFHTFLVSRGAVRGARETAGGEKSPSISSYDFPINAFDFPINSHDFPINSHDFPMIIL